MRFETWLKRERARANTHIIAGVMLTLGVGLFGPSALDALATPLLQGFTDKMRWGLLAALAVGLIRLGYGTWLRYQLEEVGYERYLQHHQ